MQEIHRDTSGAAMPATPTIERIVDFAIAAHEEDSLRGNWNPYDGYRTALWTFTRAMRSCYTERAEAEAVFFRVQEEIERRGGWDVLDTDLTAEDIYFEFISNWDRVRYKIGETPLGNALGKAKAFPLVPARASRHREFLASYSRFISIAGWLQVTMGDRSILLPVGKLSETLGVAPMTITRYRQTAEADGLLSIVKQHTYSKGEATEFRFNVAAFPILLDHAQRGTEGSFGEAA